MANNSFVGTCQACFAQQVAKGAPGAPNLVFHGYQRPGDGYTRGDCAGHGHRPYELDCSLTTQILVHHQDTLRQQRERLAALVAGQVNELTILVDTNERDHRGRGISKLVQIDRSYAGAHEKFYNSSRTFSYYLERAVAETEGAIRQSEASIRFYAEKVTAWKLAPEALVDHETWVREEEHRTKEQRAAAKAARGWAKFLKSWALAWKYVGQAVNKHAKGQRCENEWVTDEANARRLKNGWLPEFAAMYPGAKGKKSKRR